MTNGWYASITARAQSRGVVCRLQRSGWAVQVYSSAAGVTSFLTIDVRLRVPELSHAIAAIESWATAVHHARFGG